VKRIEPVRTHQNDGNFREALIIDSNLREIPIGICGGGYLPLNKFAVALALIIHSLGEASTN